MATAELDVVYGPMDVPAGTVVASIVATITGSVVPAVTQSVAPGTAAIVFQSVLTDSYSYSVSALDANGVVIGAPVTGTFTVTAANTTVSIPVTVTVALS